MMASLLVPNFRVGRDGHPSPLLSSSSLRLVGLPSKRLNHPTGPAQLRRYKDKDKDKEEEKEEDEDEDEEDEDDNATASAIGVAGSNGDVAAVNG